MTRRAILHTGLPLLLIILSWWFIWHSKGRGLSLTDPFEQIGSRLFEPGASLSNGAIYGHMALGGLITGLAPLQLIPAIRRRRPGLHRALGYGVAGLAAITACGGLTYLLLRGAIGGAPMIAGFALYGVLMLIAALQTVRFARRRDRRHRDWAARLVVLILGSYLYRVHYGLNYAIFGGLATNPEFTGTFDLIQNWAFYVPYLFLLELYLRVWAKPPEALSPAPHHR